MYTNDCARRDPTNQSTFLDILHSGNCDINGGVIIEFNSKSIEHFEYMVMIFKNMINNGMSIWHSLPYNPAGC